MNNILFTERVSTFSTLAFYDTELNIYEIKIPKNHFNSKNYPKIGDGVSITTKDNFVFGNQLYTVVGFTDDASVKLSLYLILSLKEKNIIDDDFITIGYGFKNHNILKTFTPKESKYPFPIKNRTSDMETLKKGQNFKRNGLYEQSHSTYLGILEKEGASSILYFAMAKNLACMKKYDEAILLFEMANASFKLIQGEEDFNCLYHIEQISNRNQVPKNVFLKYMKSIAGNPNYTFPK